MAGGGAGGSCARGGRALAAMLASTQALQRIPGHVGRSKFRNDSRCPKVTSEPARRRLQPEPVSSANCAVVRRRACEVDLMRHRGHWAGIGYEGALFEASCIVRIAVAPVEIALAWPLPAAPSSTTLLRALLRRSQRLDAGRRQSSLSSPHNCPAMTLAQAAKALCTLELAGSKTQNVWASPPAPCLDWAARGTPV